MASTSAMAGVFYVLAAFVLWYLVLFRREHVSGVIYDRAVAWSAMALLLVAIAAGKLRWVNWSNMQWVFIVSTAAILLAGLVSVRTITREKFGNVVLLVFVALVVSTGVSTWLWG